MSLLELHGIESGYGDLRVLQGVSMSIPTGSIEAILGRNGVGKTTLLSTIAGLLPAWNGSVTLLGRPVSGSSASQVKSLRSSLRSLASPVRSAAKARPKTFHFVTAG